MTKVIYGIFAHPDDEAFGPSGVMYDEVQRGAELHLLSLTLGGAGTNPDNEPNLSEIREQEWHASGRMIGASSQTYLGYHDGKLNNMDLITSGQQIYDIVAKRLETLGPKDEIEFITSDLNGISGHIDHIVAARAACWAFYQLKAVDNRLTRVRMACIPATSMPTANTNWLYMEAGHPDSEIDEFIDLRQYNDQIRAIMECHQTQRADLAWHLKSRGDNLGLYYFINKS